MATTRETITCYDAVTRNDPQFDGRFYTAVLTTGIFCRPGCPAPSPRPENVRFFSTAAAAAESGFRPCLRCKPELAPDPPLWQTTSPVISRALRLIGQGVLDGAGVGELARRLNISPRQLRRLFLAELGVPPIAVAQTRRLLFAKKLIDETNLSMAEVAFSAGYGSVRRFNDAIRQTYGRTPTQLRKRSRRSVLDPAGTTISLKLFYRNPYIWSAMLAYLGVQAIPGVESVDDRGYRRTIRVDGLSGSIEVRPLPDERAALVRVPSSFARYLLPITERVKDVFDLRTDSTTIDAHLQADPRLAPLVLAQPGMRIPGTWDPFELLVRSILGSGPEGEQLINTLVETFGDPLSDTTDPTVSRLFPTPETLSDADLVGIGLARSQADAIRRASRAISDEALDLSAAAQSDSLIARLMDGCRIPRSAASLIAMRALGDPDIWPDESHPAHDRSERWRPWRSYAAMYHWSAEVQI